MQHHPFIILYVADPQASASWYAQVLAQQPVQASPGFVLFALNTGAMLGLWRRDAVLPPVHAAAGGSELALALQGRYAVDLEFARLQRLGCAVTQAPTPMDFGYTFTVQDPDGHRVRVFAPQDAAPEL